MVQLCNIKILANPIQSVLPFNVDSFLTQLLESEKFDELADKIADKAVDKIRHIGSPPTTVERVANKINVSKDLRQNAEIDDKKLDTETVPFAENKSQEDVLKLNYKYLTRNAYTNDNIAEPVDQPYSRNTNDQDNPSGGKNSHTENDSEKVKYVMKAEKATQRNNDQPNFNKNQKSRIKYEDSGDLSQEVMTENRLKKVMSQVQEPIHNATTAEEEEMSTIEKWPKENEGQIPSYADKSQEKSDSKLKKRLQDVFFAPVKFKSNYDNSDTDNDVNRVNLRPEDLSNQAQESRERGYTTKKPVLRHEGDKVFAFVDKSEYQEYHEEVDKARKENPEAAAAFL